MENEEHSKEPVKLSIDACRAIVKQRGWRWEKGMRILEANYLDLEDGKHKSCEPCNVDDVIIHRPFSDKYMQCVRKPIPDLSDEQTLERCLTILRELWQHNAIRLVDSGEGFAIITRTGQFWAPTKSEAILMGFENISWNDRDNGRWRN